MDIIFIGYAVNDRIAEKLTGISIAGNKMQLDVLKYMEPAFENVFSTTIYPVSSFPKDHKLYYPKNKDVVVGNIQSIRVPFINITGIKQICQIINNYLEIKKLAKKSPDALLFTFNMYPQVGLPAVWIKKRYGNKIACLLADLPIDDNYNRSGIKKKIWDHYFHKTESFIKQIDKAIVLNKHAWELYCPGSECLVMDGGMDCNEDSSSTPDSEGYFPERKNLLYGGSLNEYSGIRELVEAMSYVDDESVELDIYGNGNLKDYIISHQNDRIHYKGVVKNSEMLELQKKAWVLVNPRPIDDRIAMVTFPSKIFEYLNSGTPVITTKLNGFSEEYLDKCFFSETNDPVKLAECINRVASLDQDDLREIAVKARNFIREKKNWKTQTQRIVDFLKQ